MNVASEAGFALGNLICRRKNRRLSEVTTGIRRIEVKVRSGGRFDSRKKSKSVLPATAAQSAPALTTYPANDMIEIGLSYFFSSVTIMRSTLIIC